MASPVRLRGEVGERRVVHQRQGVNFDGKPVVAFADLTHYDGRVLPMWEFDRRSRTDRRLNLSIAARVNEIIAHLQAARAVECGRLEREISELKAKVAGLEGRNAGLQEALALNGYRAQEGSYEPE